MTRYWDFRHIGGEGLDKETILIRTKDDFDQFWRLVAICLRGDNQARDEFLLREMRKRQDL